MGKGPWRWQRLPGSGGCSSGGGRWQTRRRGARHAQRSADPGAESQPLFPASNLALFISHTKELFIMSGAEKSPAKKEWSVLWSPGLPRGFFPPPAAVFVQRRDLSECP